MKVLSLFDGISCGHVALDRAGIKVDTYYAFEIEPNAIQITQYNYPNTIQCGDVLENDFTQFKDIDILLGGSPCTFWSIAKNNREIDKSGMGWKLFERYLLALRNTKPKYFLYENVASMPPTIKKHISEEFGCEPILIDSALVSAQSRKRLYWTNIPSVKQPEDRGILLKNVIESGLVDRDKSLCLTRRYCAYVGSQSYLRRRYFGKAMGQAVFEDTTPEIQKQHWKLDDRKEWEGIGRIRSLRVIEVERCQTLPEGYVGKVGVSEVVAKETIGNGWNVDTIAHILSFINK